MNKRAEAKSFGIIIFVLLLVIIAIVLLVQVFAPNGSTNLDSLPFAAGQLVETVVAVLTPIANLLFAIVAPAGQDENTQMIAFSVFLLLSFVGMKALEPFFKNKGVSLLVSVIVGIIGARSLTATVLDEIALGATPLAAASLIMTFLFVLGASHWIERTGMNQYMKLMVMVIVGIVIWIFYTFVYSAWNLGVVYGVGTVLLACLQTIAPYFKRTQAQKRNMSLGRYMAGVHNDIEVVKQMSAGASS